MNLVLILFFFLEDKKTLLVNEASTKISAWNLNLMKQSYEINHLMNDKGKKEDLIRINNEIILYVNDIKLYFVNL